MENQETKNEARIGGSALNAGLERAARAVVRYALDNVDVHPCDENNDEVRGSKLYGPMRELYDALRSNMELTRFAEGESGGAKRNVS